MLARLPRDVKKYILLFLGRELNWEVLRERAQEYSKYCNLYVNDYAVHRSLLQRYATEEMWATFSVASKYWKKEGTELRNIMVTAALDLQIFFLVRLPPGVHYTEKFK